MRQPRRPVALVAVEMRVQDPLHLPDAQPRQQVGDQAQPAVDEDRPLAAPQQVDVADVLDQEETGAQFPYRRQLVPAHGRTSSISMHAPPAVS